jgi:glutathione synthase
MPLKVAVQMDPVERISIAGDTTFALMLEAAARGHELFYYKPENLSLRDGCVVAFTAPIAVRDIVGDHFSLGPAQTVDLTSMDVVLLRQDPPFDLAYITSTHILQRLAPSTLVVNDPVSVRNAPEKLFVMDFPELMPPTLITRDKAEIEAFRRQHGEIVMKPLHGHGGTSVFKVAEKDANFGSLYDLFATTFREQWVVQAYLQNIVLGDKRIILVEGEPLGAVNRVPAENDIRSNMVRGGAAAATQFSDRELEICAAIGPELRRRGLLLVGIDVIDGYLTEINVTSPTGIRAIKRVGGPDLAVAVWDAIEAKRQ